VAWRRIAYSRIKNAVNTPIINPEKVYLPPMHITLGLTKNFLSQ
jgi:hypothetical protein